MWNYTVLKVQRTKRRDGILLDPFLFFSLVFPFFPKRDFSSSSTTPPISLLTSLYLSTNHRGGHYSFFAKSLLHLISPKKKKLPNLHNCACLCISRLGDGLVPSYRHDMSITILTVTWHARQRKEQRPPVFSFFCMSSPGIEPGY